MKRHHYIAITLILVLILSCSKAEFVPAEITTNTLSSEMDIAVDDIYNAHKNKLNTVGLSIGILKSGETHFYGYGETKEGSGNIPNKNTFYEIGSITKTFTAIMAVKMLSEDGLDVETSIKPYLPNDLPTLNRNGIELNFKHLLTHTSGLSRMPSNFSLSKKVAEAYADYDNRLLYSFLENARLHADPFTQFSYSNAGFGVVGTILERKYDLDYGEVLRKEITTPLNLKNTTAYFEDTNKSDWATGYGFTGKEVDYWKSLNALDGAGVIKSTAADLIAYAGMNLNPPDTELGAAITKTHELYFDKYVESNYSKIRNCLGWFEYTNTELPEKTFLWHGGDTEGFSAVLLLDLEAGNALVVLYNTQVQTNERELLVSDLLKLITL